MNHIRGTADTNQGGGFDPGQATALTDQATRQARRQFTPLTALLWTFRAIAILIVGGSLWLSVRGQHPYSGPTSWVWAVAVVAAATNLGLTAWVTGRTGAGVGGPAQREWRPWKPIMLAAWIIAYLATAPHYHAGISHPVWGMYPASAPLLIIGLASAAVAAAFRYWPMASASLAIAVVAAASGFAGPAGSWLILGVGLSAAYLGTGAFKIWQQRHSMVRPS